MAAEGRGGLCAVWGIQGSGMEACVSVRGGASQLKRGTSGEETIQTQGITDLELISLGKVRIKTAMHGGAQ
jgi:hypothetical protein